MPEDLCTFCREPITGVPVFDEDWNAYCDGDCWFEAEARRQPRTRQTDSEWARIKKAVEQAWKNAEIRGTVQRAELSDLPGAPRKV